MIGAKFKYSNWGSSIESGIFVSYKVRASELVNGVPGSDESTVSTAEVAITIRDVNDEAPTFKQREYQVTIPENVPFGTPLANLNMEVADTDTGPNSRFKIELIDNTGKFTVEPARATGQTAVSLKVNSKNLDYENPNERKFLLLVVATETDTREKLSSTGGFMARLTFLYNIDTIGNGYRFYRFSIFLEPKFIFEVYATEVTVK